MRSDGFGRTGWDMVYNGRYTIYVLVGVAALGVMMFLFGDRLDMEPVSDLVTTYWPVLLCPLAGYWFAVAVVNRYYRPSGRGLIVLYPETHTVLCLYVSEEIYKGMRQSGNNVLYHTPLGTPVYIARHIDMSTGDIDYGWVHELDPLVVMTREDAYVKWDDTLNLVLEENLELMSHPHTIGLGYAREGLRRHLDMMAGIMGFKGQDYEPHRNMASKKDDEDRGTQDGPVDDPDVEKDNVRRYTDDR